MSDFAPTGRARLRGVTIAIVALLAFFAGLALAAYLVHSRPRWFGKAQVSPQAIVTGQPETPAGMVAAPPQQAASTAVIDPITLADREAVLAAQLAALEARTASVSVDAAAASGQAGRAEAMLVAFAARRAIDRGIGLGYVEGQLTARFGQRQPRATAAVIAMSRTPVTVEDLRTGLDAVAGDLAGGTTGWWPGLRSEFGSLVVLHKAGTPSPLPADRLARARRMLDEGRVEAALGEIAQLPAAGAAANWTIAARRWVGVHRALDEIESAAILGQAG